MFKRILWVMLALALGVLPAAAQDNLLGWIPADFAGFVDLRIREGETFTTLNLAALVASFLQPERIQYQPLQALENLIPLNHLDIEDVSFQNDIFPWLSSRVIIAYAAIGPDFQDAEDHTVLILPTRDVLQSASSFSRIMQAQDILEQESYRGQTLYLADKTTIAFVPEAVLIGPRELVEAVIDTHAGETERLIDQPAYTAVVTASPQNAIVSGFIKGSEALRVLSVLIEGDESALPVLQGLSDVLDTYRQGTSLEEIILDEALDGVAFGLQADTVRLNTVHVTLTLFTDAVTTPAAAAEFNSDLLNLLPQNAMIVQNGTDAPGAIYNLLAALPLVNFAGRVVGAFPVQSTMPEESLSTPGASDIEQALGGWLSVLNRQANFDLDHDLLDHLNGSYTVALLPRPNDPLLPLNTPYDVLLVAEVDDPEAALNGAAQLTEVLLPLNPLENATIDDIEFSVVKHQGEPVLQMGIVDNLLVVATGDALEPSLDARRGDDRLISRDRWNEISRDTVPQWYVDIPAVYSTFLPQYVGPQLQEIRQLGLRTEVLGEGLFQMHLTVTRPSQFS